MNNFAPKKMLKYDYNCIEKEEIMEELKQPNKKKTKENIKTTIKWDLKTKNEYEFIEFTDSITIVINRFAHL